MALRVRQKTLYLKMRALEFQDKGLKSTQNNKPFSLKITFHYKRNLNKMTPWLSTNQMNIWKLYNRNPLE